MAKPSQAEQEVLDRRFMAAALRLSRKNAGRTATNPSVGTLI
ncbi:MAG: riboflavin biosynthesis protein RibD, partial [Mesorhizobium sp.]